MVNVACQACAKVLRFSEKDLGNRIHCPQCGHPQVLGHAVFPDDGTTQGPPGKADVNLRPTPDHSEPPPIPPLDTSVNRPEYGMPLGGRTSFLGPPERPDEIGRLGGYRILTQLGAGGMGVVFLAEDVTLNRKIALKVLPPGETNEPTARDRFFREARAAAALEHENIITVHQVSEDRGVVFLAMPLLKGKPLDRHMCDHGFRPLPLGDVLRIGREIAAGLAAAHDQNLIHRDIKPANIWLEDMAGRGSSRRAFRVKILDFGLARSARDERGLTQTGIVVGTPAYMSPEQARGPNLDSRSDLFSLGSVLYEAATGQRPFSGKDALAILASLAADMPPLPIDLNADVPDELSDLIMELLEKNPADRPATARAVEARLREIELEGARGPSALTARLTTARWTRRRRDGHRPALWVGGAVTIVGLFAGWLFFAPSTQDDKAVKEPPKGFDPKKTSNGPKGPKDKKGWDDKGWPKWKDARGEVGPDGPPFPPGEDPPPEMRFPPKKKDKGDKGPWFPKKKKGDDFPI